MKCSPKILAAATVFCLGLAAPAVFAQQAGSTMPAAASSTMAPMHKGLWHHKMHRKVKGSVHNMPATVTSVDTSSGIVEVTSEGMSLRVHFPPASIAHLKAGDKIILHLGYSISP